MLQCFFCSCFQLRLSKKIVKMASTRAWCSRSRFGCGREMPESTSASTGTVASKPWYLLLWIDLFLSLFLVLFLSPFLVLVLSHFLFLVLTPFLVLSPFSLSLSHTHSLVLSLLMPDQNSLIELRLSSSQDDFLASSSNLLGNSPASCCVSKFLMLSPILGDASCCHLHSKT